MGALFHAIALPLYWVISGILVLWHKIFAFLPSEGWAWALAIVGLTVTIRALLIPVMVKQIKSMRNMQLIQPQMKAVQEKYKHDRERMSQEMMKLYKDNGTNPFASCLPILIQMPIFFSLFALLRHAVQGHGNGFLSDSAAASFGQSHWLGTLLGASLTNTHGYHSTQIIAPVLVVLMTLTQFLTSRQILTKNMPPAAMTGQYAQQQKIMMYVLPVVFSVGSFGFPIGLMLYWTVSNLWTMGQQYVVIKASPTPGSPAAIAKEKRDREKAAQKGAVATTSSAVFNGEEAVEAPRAAQRAQPKRQTKAQRQSGTKTPKKKDD
ncbi:membrane protein insertase YidC [Nocardioides baekrokdamisoli]|uniref:Membrane protein insertase YidC n=1 Tax=Nocardioides baekrokdamisoli TaxID=1804624 RepID=A0A3G9IEH8_9ACTN|nr:membrane protein insertase YidC [Nocardioides baekrokdamisoli]BBH17390.1 membrane protein insertase YidC [Nocardioides baekrokdamisoli]